MVTQWRPRRERIPGPNRTRIRHPSHERIPSSQRSQERSLLYVPFPPLLHYLILVSRTKPIFSNSCNMAPLPPSSHLWWIRRLNPPLGSLLFIISPPRPIPKPTTRSTRHALPSTRLQRLVSRLPSSRSSPRLRLQ